jgi:hypothetical protein
MIQFKSTSVFTQARHVVRDHERRQTGNEFGCHKAVGREPSPTLQCRYPIFHKPAIDLVVGFLANVSG